MGMFDDAKTLTTAKPKAKKATQDRIEIVGLEDLASIEAVIKSLEAIKAVRMGQVKQAMATQFITSGAERGARPENFRGIEGTASASCELRARSSASALTPDEIEIYEQYNLPTETVESVVETFVINPSYLNDPKVMSSIEAALKKAKGMPEDLFLKQEGVSKTIAGEHTLKVLFENESDEDTLAELLPLCGTMAVKPTLETDDIAAAFKLAAAIINPSPAKKGK